MIRNDRVINSLAYGDMVERVIKEHKVGLTEAREIISQMSFMEYMALEEASANIVPPSGNQISAGPSAATIKPSGTPSQQPAQNPTGQTPPPAPTVAPAATTNQVKNPQTGTMDLQKPGAPPVPGNVQQQAMGEDVEEDLEEDTSIERMRQLAGIKENASCGATGAGSIAVANVPMGGMKKRPSVIPEQKPVEYTRTEPYKTVVGDTKPNQASGELSANLAASGKRTASRNKNGLRR